MEYKLKLQKITKESFKEFGHFQCTPPVGESSFSSDRFDWYDEIVKSDLQVASFGMVCPKYTGKFVQPALEQHKKTQEIYIPLDGDVIIVVAKPDALDKQEFNESDFAAFHVPKGTMVIMDEGVWHEAPMTLNERTNVLVIYRDKTGEEDKKLIEMSDIDLKLEVVL